MASSDELLIRIDERTANMKDDLVDIKEHARVANVLVSEHEKRLTTVEVTLLERVRFGDTNRKMIVGMWGLVVAGLGAIITILIRHVGV